MYGLLYTHRCDGCALLAMGLREKGLPSENLKKETIMSLLTEREGYPLPRGLLLTRFTVGLERGLQG